MDNGTMIQMNIRIINLSEQQREHLC